MSQISEILVYFSECLTKTMQDLSVRQLCMLAIALLVVILIAYKFYSFIYVFSDEFREMKELKLKKFRSFNRLSERPPDYPNGWIPLLESSQLKANKTETVLALGYEFVMFRGPSGKAYVIDAFCPHLGAHFGIGSVVDRTKSGADCIQCPFHGWNFRAEDGVCLSIPNFDEEEVKAVNAKLKIWKSLEINDVIYVWHHSEHKGPDWEPDIVPQIHTKKWICLGRTEYVLDCHIQEIEENWTDMAHFTALHEPLFYPFNNLNKVQKFFAKLISFSIRTNWTAIGEPKHYNSTASIDALSKVFGLETWAMNFGFCQVGPATLNITYDNPIMGGVSGALVQYVYPMAPNKLKFILRNYCENTFRSRLFAKILYIFELFMIERDMLVWNNKRFVKNAKYLKTDKPISQFRRWYSQYYSDNSFRSVDW